MIVSLHRVYIYDCTYSTCMCTMTYVVSEEYRNKKMIGFDSLEADNRDIVKRSQRWSRQFEK